MVSDPWLYYSVAVCLRGKKDFALNVALATGLPNLWTDAFKHSLGHPLCPVMNNTAHTPSQAQHALVLSDPLI